MKNLQAVLGVGLIVAGVALWSVPSAFVVGGVLVLLDLVTPDRPK